jgi:tellurite resistance protein
MLSRPSGRIENVNDAEKKEIAASLIAAACADGHLGPDERQRIARFMDDLGGGEVFRAALANPVTPEQLGQRLTSPDAKRTAYQLAVLVCQADAVLNSQETEYLGKLRGALGLSEAAARGLEAEADHWRDPGLPPTSTPSEVTDLDRRILQFAMLAGAAELLPQTMASMAVLPLQLRLVYEVGRQNGVTLARTSSRSSPPRSGSAPRHRQWSRSRAACWVASHVQWAGESSVVQRVLRPARSCRLRRRMRWVTPRRCTMRRGGT